MFTKCTFYEINLYMFVFTLIVLLYRIDIELMADMVTKITSNLEYRILI